MKEQIEEMDTIEYIKREDAMKALDEYRLSQTMSKFGDRELLMEYRDGVIGAMNALAFVPIADVVPKSEVAILNVQLAAKEKAYFELQHEFETYKGVEKIIDDGIPKLVEGVKEEMKKQKAEIERLERICHSYALQYGTVKDQQAVIDKAKAEVAREIFAEIERKSCVISETNHSTGSARVVCYQISADKLAELKKKYTEGEPNG